MQDDVSNGEINVSLYSYYCFSLIFEVLVFLLFHIAVLDILV